MPAPSRTPRTSWIEEGLRALGVGGLDAVRIEKLAETLGVTKGGFYGQFDDRNALLGEMLNTWERVGVDAVIDGVEREGRDARGRLRRLFEITSSSAHLMKVEFAIREWARRDEAVATRLRHVDNRRMEYLRVLFGGICRNQDDVEVRCLLAFSLWIGNYLIAAHHGSRRRADVLELALRQLEA